MGYIGHKMSERAVEAYRSGERPLTKWTRDEILKGFQKVFQFENSSQVQKNG